LLHDQKLKSFKANDVREAFLAGKVSEVTEKETFVLAENKRSKARPSGNKKAYFAYLDPTLFLKRTARLFPEKIAAIYPVVRYLSIPVIQRISLSHTSSVLYVLSSVATRKKHQRPILQFLN
jgi:hypothetical protein